MLGKTTALNPKTLTLNPKTIETLEADKPGVSAGEGFEFFFGGGLGRALGALRHMDRESLGGLSKVVCPNSNPPSPIFRGFVFDSNPQPSAQILNPKP